MHICSSYGMACAQFPCPSLRGFLQTHTGKPYQKLSRNNFLFLRSLETTPRPGLSSLCIITKKTIASIFVAQGWVIEAEDIYGSYLATLEDIMLWNNVYRPLMFK
ncbi:hypothetical protein RchiOBHm_Chr6g0257871 [Rosa chinensis]|uniref:Uncharacterized protein n=1 Tax=Rosa chinensis TaxID=74649 RepID=A0A2P6PMI3_ROSCH|nr:hypothetical protein RchiOBHm_Chr6g0257871 [Rosa chinensis]